MFRISIKYSVSDLQILKYKTWYSYKYPQIIGSLIGISKLKRAQPFSPKHICCLPHPFMRMPWFYFALTLHLQSITKFCQLNLHNVAQISPHLPSSSTAALVHATTSLLTRVFITSQMVSLLLPLLLHSVARRILFYVQTSDYDILPLNTGRWLLISSPLNESQSDLPVLTRADPFTSDLIFQPSPSHFLLCSHTDLLAVPPTLQECFHAGPLPWMVFLPGNLFRGGLYGFPLTYLRSLLKCGILTETFPHRPIENCTLPAPLNPPLPSSVFLIELITF